MRPLRVALVPAGIGLGLFAEWAALRRGPLQEAASAADIRLAVADLAVGAVLIAAGVAAWWRRPESWTGALLALGGFTWFLGTFAASGWPGYADFGALFLTLHRGPLAHALLSYPSGRVDRWSERAAVALAYATSAIADVAATRPGGIALAVILVALSGERLVRSSGPQRRARAVAAIGSAAFAAVLVAGSLWAYDAVIAAIASGLALDLVLGRWVRATVTGLVVDLGEHAEAGRLRDRLASALGDPSLVVGYRLSDADTYVDERGQEVAVPNPGDRRVTVVRDGDEPVAALVHDPGLVADPELLGSVAAAARLALANARLQAEVRRQVEELDASRRRLVEAGDAERRRLERELREGAEETLARLDTLVLAASRAARGSLATTLSETEAKVRRARSELLELARGIHPRVLAEGGLAAGLRDLADRSALPVDLSAPHARFPAAVEAAAYFVCSEALANAGKHADAARVQVDIADRGGSLVVSIRDDGHGGASIDGGSGLRGLVDRVEALGGRLTLTSPPGEGTRLTAELPLS